MRKINRLHSITILSNPSSRTPLPCGFCSSALYSVRSVPFLSFVIRLSFCEISLPCIQAAVLRVCELLPISPQFWICRNLIDDGIWRWIYQSLSFFLCLGLFFTWFGSVGFSGVKLQCHKSSWACWIKPSRKFL